MARNLPMATEDATLGDGLCARAARMIEEVGVLAEMVAIFLQLGEMRTTRVQLYLLQEFLQVNIVGWSRICPRHHTDR